MHQGWQWAIKVPRADVLACACLPERIYERIVTQIVQVTLDEKTDLPL